MENGEKKNPSICSLFLLLPKERWNVLYLKELFLKGSWWFVFTLFACSASLKVLSLLLHCCPPTCTYLRNLFYSYYKRLVKFLLLTVVIISSQTPSLPSSIQVNISLPLLPPYYWHILNTCTCIYLFPRFIDCHLLLLLLLSFWCLPHPLSR